MTRLFSGSAFPCTDPLVCSGLDPPLHWTSSLHRCPFCLTSPPRVGALHTCSKSDTPHWPCPDTFLSPLGLQHPVLGRAPHECPFLRLWEAPRCRSARIHPHKPCPTCVLRDTLSGEGGLEGQTPSLLTEGTCGAIAGVVGTALRVQSSRDLKSFLSLLWWKPAC